MKISVFLLVFALAAFTLANEDEVAPHSMRRTGHYGAPRYLGVPNFRACLESAQESTASYYCRPQTKPSACPLASWKELTGPSGSLLKECPTKAKAAAGCKKDSDCHAGGDMGGYCKANKDCHCTAPFFGSNGKGSCALTCTPTSKTPCCRNNNDCQKGGDKGAYCKSPKSTLHTTPGNGMCRCSAGFSGTTACNKHAFLGTGIAALFESRLHHHHGHHHGLLWRATLFGLLFALFLFFCVRCCRRRTDTSALQQTYENLRSDDDAAVAEAMRLSLAESSSGTIKPVDVPLVAGAPKPPPGVHFGSSNQV